MELGRFEHERIEDFKVSLESFLEGMIRKQKNVRDNATFLGSSSDPLLLVDYQIMGELPRATNETRSFKSDIQATGSNTIFSDGRSLHPRFTFWVAT